MESAPDAPDAPDSPAWDMSLSKLVDGIATFGELDGVGLTLPEELWRDLGRTAVVRITITPVAVVQPPLPPVGIWTEGDDRP